MYILAGESKIENVTVYGETRFYKGSPRPALKVKVSSGLTPEQIQSLLSNDWHLMDVEGEKEVERNILSGYTELESHEAVFIQMDALEMENAKLKEEVQAASSSISTLIKGRDDDIIVDVLRYIPEWNPGKYVVGDVRKTADGYPMTCTQAHDSTNNPTNNISVSSLWSPYHAKSKSNALPWIKPTGAHDMYKAGEWMVFTDGSAYECLSNTDRSPTEYAQAWKKTI